MAESVAVVGLGGIGLPLALSFADRGLRGVGVDKEPSVLDSIRDGHMPFHETGTQELLERVMTSGRLELTESAADVVSAEHIVLTLGTPAHSHIEIDIAGIRSVLDQLLPLLQPGHSVILRSTVAPGTTDWVAGYLEQRRGFTVGEDLFVSHVPERIPGSHTLAETHCLGEIPSLPAIIGGPRDASGAKAPELSEVFGTQIVQTTPLQAE